MEHLVDLQRNGLKMLEDSDKFRFGMDAVFLSGWAEVKKGERVLDMGTGTGILPLLLSAKTEAGQIVGIEVQQECAELAARNITLNGLSDRITVVNGDLKDSVNLFGKASFDVVVSNPPYMTGGHGLVNPQSAKAIARHEVLCSFADVAEQAAAVLKPGGRLYLVHRPFRLPEIITTLVKFGLEPKRLRMVHSYVDKEPNMMLLGCVKGGKPRIQVEKPLIVWEKPGKYTEEVVNTYGF